MSVYEPASILQILAAVQTQTTTEKFVAKWLTDVAKISDTWATRRNKVGQHVHRASLEWSAHVMMYVDFLAEQVKVHGNAKSVAKTTKRAIDLRLPILGPLFVPPGYAHLLQRSKGHPAILPEVHYIPWLTVVHPFFYPEILKCPKCGCTDTARLGWNQWNVTGPRDVHGLFRDGMALGVQLRCMACNPVTLPSGKRAAQCCITTSPVFWENWAHWEIPRKLNTLIVDRVSHRLPVHSHYRWRPHFLSAFSG